MGISANQARLMMLTARQHDLELRAQQISAHKMMLINESQIWATKYNDALKAYSESVADDPDNIATYKAVLDLAKEAYDSSTTNITNEEKILDMQLTNINTEHEAVKTEYDSIKSLVKDNTEKSFNVFG